MLTDSSLDFSTTDDKFTNLFMNDSYILKISNSGNKIYQYLCILLVRFIGIESPFMK